MWRGADVPKARMAEIIDVIDIDRYDIVYRLSTDADDDNVKSKNIEN